MGAEMKLDLDAIEQRHRQVLVSRQVDELDRALLAFAKEARATLKKSEKRFSHIEDWHRDYVTPDNFKDCQDMGLTPEAYLRDGKNEIREVLTRWFGEEGEK